MNCSKGTVELKHTWGNKIRSMSDEELAEFIEQVSTDSMETISFGTKEYEEIWEHKETALKWLQSEAEQQKGAICGQGKNPIKTMELQMMK